MNEPQNENCRILLDICNILSNIAEYREIPVIPDNLIAYIQNPSNGFQIVSINTLN